MVPRRRPLATLTKCSHLQNAFDFVGCRSCRFLYVNGTVQSIVAGQISSRRLGDSVIIIITTTTTNGLRTLRIVRTCSIRRPFGLYDWIRSLIVLSPVFEGLSRITAAAAVGRFSILRLDESSPRRARMMIALLRRFLKLGRRRLEPRRGTWIRDGSRSRTGRGMWSIYTYQSFRLF